MNQTEDASDREIDIFEFVDLIIKRKSIIIYSLVVSIIIGTLYSYFNIYKFPPLYEISMVIRLPYDDSLNHNVFNQLDGWFASGAYKAELKKLNNLNDAPIISTVVHQRAFAELNMNYSNAEKGKIILNSVLEVLTNSNFLKTHFKDSIEILETNRNSTKVQYELLLNKKKDIMERIDKYLNSIDYNRNIIKKRHNMASIHIIVCGMALIHNSALSPLVKKSRGRKRAPPNI